MLWYLSSNFTSPNQYLSATASFVDTANMWPGMILSIEDNTCISVFEVTSVSQSTSQAVLFNRYFPLVSLQGHIFLAGTVAYSEGVGMGTVTQAGVVPMPPYDKFGPLDNDPPSTLYATFDIVNGISTLGFSDSATWTAIFKSILPQYSLPSSGCVIRVKWASVSATSGVAMFGAAFERMNQTFNSDHFGTQTTVLTTTNAVAGDIVESSMPISYANMGSPVAGDPYRIQIQRIGANAGDTLVGNAELTGVTIEPGIF